MSGHQSCKSYIIFVSEIPMHDFCCGNYESLQIVILNNF